MTFEGNLIRGQQAIVDKLKVIYQKQKNFDDLNLLICEKI